LHNLFTLNARIVGNLEVILARLVAITWTCSWVIGQVVPVRFRPGWLGIPAQVAVPH